MQTFKIKSLIHGAFCYFYDKTRLKYCLFRKKLYICSQKLIIFMIMKKQLCAAAEGDAAAVSDVDADAVGAGAGGGDGAAADGQVTFFVFGINAVEVAVDGERAGAVGLAVDGEGAVEADTVIIFIFTIHRHGFTVVKYEINVALDGEHIVVVDVAGDHVPCHLALLADGGHIAAEHDGPVAVRVAVLVDVIVDALRPRRRRREHHEGERQGTE